MIDVSKFQGVTIPLRELVAEIEARGWEPNVGLKGGEYVAEGKNPHGESLEGTGPTDATAVSNLLVKIMRRETIRGGTTYAKVRLASWNIGDLHDRLEPMAHEYAQAPVYDPKAASYWKELGDDSNMRADVLRNQLHIEETPEPEPYQTAQEMLDDIHKNQHFWVSTNQFGHHPIWDGKTNTNFRIVHDVLGHGVSGGNFDWPGEIAACSAHFPLLSPGAQKALAQECIGQTAAGAYYRSFMPQKVSIPSWIEDLQARENPAAHTGVHPSQSLAPVEAPQVKPFQQTGLPWATQVPHEDFSGGLPMFGKTAQDVSPRDPNALWESGVTPLQPNAYLDHGDPLQAQAVKDNAMKIDTGWSQMDMDTIKQAIMNAFRAVLLSPRKDLKWNAVHFQDISDIPSTVTDPKRYWDQLESRRVAWNTARGYAEDSHRPWFKERGDYRKLVAIHNPDLSPIDAQKKADKEFQIMWEEEEDKLELDPKNAELSADQIERKVEKEITKRLKEIVNPAKPANDYDHQQMRMGAINPGQLDLQGQEPGKYGAFMGSHLRQIATLSQHIDQLAEAALQDVNDHDGTGYHFRSQVLQLGISGVGPKVASFAWLLLQPGTSQLATIDTHMMDVLGHDYAKEMNDRDYFKFERELSAGRDAAGYQHVPLGQFQWGMWDYKRTGPGSHQDHSALAPLSPTPYDQINWAQKMPMTQEWQDPDWWAATQPARQQVGDDYKNEVANQFSQNEIPRTAKVSQIPVTTRYIQHGGQTHIGNPGETYMNLARRKLGLSPEEIWKLGDQIVASPNAPEQVANASP
jgi:hypothetical protein